MSPAVRIGPWREAVELSLDCTRLPGLKTTSHNTSTSLTKTDSMIANSRLLYKDSMQNRIVFAAAVFSPPYDTPLVQRKSIMEGRCLLEESLAPGRRFGSPQFSTLFVFAGQGTTRVWTSTDSGITNAKHRAKLRVTLVLGYMYDLCCLKVQVSLSSP
jgi:hypothetical protein